MKNKINTSDFDFEFTGSEFTEEEILAKGHTQLSGKELLLRIQNKTIFGEYLMGYKFVTDIYENGITEGINNAGTQDFGNWNIDYEKNTIQLVWRIGWFDTLSRAYEVNGSIEFYDVETGNWRTTFKRFVDWED